MIFGDPNKADGFQKMLQRVAVYHHSKTPDEMVEVCEILLKEDIDRSQSFVPRTLRSIIFNRWVIQSQDDPSVAEVVRWTRDCGLRLYSFHPSALMPLRADSFYHQPKFDPASATSLLAIPELIWMLHTDADADAVNVEAITRVRNSRLSPSRRSPATFSHRWNRFDCLIPSGAS